MSNEPALTREALYTLIWSEPATKIAARYGVSDRGLGKLCARHNIPVPPRGYWARKAHGYNPKQIPLPPAKHSYQAQAIVLEKRQPPTPPPTPPQSEIPEIDFEQDPDNLIVVPERLGRVHPLVEKTREALKGKKADQRGRVFPWGGVLDVTVAPNSVLRALRIMQALITALSARGHEVRVKEKERSTVVEMLGEALEIDLVERTKQVRSVPPRSYRAYELEPTGVLILRVSRSYPSAEISDTKHKAIEDRLNEFVIKLIEEARRQRGFRKARERREAEWREQERLQAIEEDKQREEDKKIKQWDEWMNAWRRAREVRAFARVIRRKLSAIKEGSEVAGWLQWAEGYAESVNPFRVHEPK